MEFLIEILLGLLLEGSVEATKSKKVPKGIRAVLICLLSLAVVGLIGGTIALGALLEVIGAVLLVSAIKKAREHLRRRKEKEEILAKGEKGEKDGDNL